MKNNLLKLLTNDKEIRLYIIEATDIINQNILESIKKDTVKQLYKKLVVNCALLRGLLSDSDQRLSVSIHFRPEGHSFHCYIDGKGNINSMLSSQLCDYSEDINHLVGRGATLSITRGGWSTGMFTGTVEINNSSVDQFFSYFFTQSEQTETIFRSWIDSEYVRGCMIQPLPFADDLNINHLINIINLNEKRFSMGSWDEIPTIIFPDTKIIEEYLLQLECDCSKEMFYGLLMSVNINDLRQSILENRSEELECGICGKKYLFNRNALESIVKIKERQQHES